MKDEYTSWSVLCRDFRGYPMEARTFEDAERLLACQGGVAIYAEVLGAHYVRVSAPEPRAQAYFVVFAKAEGRT